MDNYINECKACWCKKAREAIIYDVFFNCNACPFSECSEPDTRKAFLNGQTERELLYKRKEEREKLQKMKDEEYRRSQEHRRAASFAATVRKKVESKTLLSKREFAKALRFCDTKDARMVEFYTFKYLVKYQLSLLGFIAAAEEIVDYIENLEMY